MEHERNNLIILMFSRIRYFDTNSTLVRSKNSKKDLSI